MPRSASRSPCSTGTASSRARPEPARRRPSKELGGVSAATAGVILRELTAFAAKGAEQFFGESEFEVADVLRTVPDGRGVVSVLELPAVQDSPELFSTFLMWLLAELFETLPEVGDADKPKLVFFFDEAHLLFNGATKAFLDSVTQTVRLIRSKGVGVFSSPRRPRTSPPRYSPSWPTACSTPYAPSLPTTPRRSKRQSPPSRSPAMTSPRC